MQASFPFLATMLFAASVSAQTAGELSTLPRVGNVHTTFPSVRFKQCNRLSRPPMNTRSSVTAGVL